MKKIFVLLILVLYAISVPLVSHATYNESDYECYQNSIRAKYGEKNIVQQCSDSDTCTKSGNNLTCASKRTFCESKSATNCPSDFCAVYQGFKDQDPECRLRENGLGSILCGANSCYGSQICYEPYSAYKYFCASPHFLEDNQQCKVSTQCHYGSFCKNDSYPGTCKPCTAGTCDSDNIPPPPSSNKPRCEELDNSLQLKGRYAYCAENCSTNETYNSSYSCADNPELPIQYKCCQSNKIETTPGPRTTTSPNTTQTPRPPGGGSGNTGTPCNGTSPKQACGTDRISPDAALCPGNNWFYLSNSSANSWCTSNVGGGKDYCYQCAPSGSSTSPTTAPTQPGQPCAKEDGVKSVGGWGESLCNNTPFDQTKANSGFYKNGIYSEKWFCNGGDGVDIVPYPRGTATGDTCDKPAWTPSNLTTTPPVSTVRGEYCPDANNDVNRYCPAAAPLCNVYNLTSTTKTGSCVAKNVLPQNSDCANRDDVCQSNKCLSEGPKRDTTNNTMFTGKGTCQGFVSSTCGDMVGKECTVPSDCLRFCTTQAELNRYTCESISVGYRLCIDKTVTPTGPYPTRYQSPTPVPGSCAPGSCSNCGTITSCNSTSNCFWCGNSCQGSQCSGTSPSPSNLPACANTAIEQCQQEGTSNRCLAGWDNISDRKSCTSPAVCCVQQPTTATQPTPTPTRAYTASDCKCGSYNGSDVQCGSGQYASYFEQFDRPTCAEFTYCWICRNN